MDQKTISPLKKNQAHALLCLLAMGLIFYTSYGLSNYLAALTAPHPEIYFAWERHIPFISWTIIPYWSLNVFYAVSFFMAENASIRLKLLRQLLLAQGIAIFFFVLIPLQFTWPKPPLGVGSHLFELLGSFDEPYNQAPSLHIILSLIIGHFYYDRLKPIYRPLWIIWIIVIMLSVLSTFQHHFIDIPTGILAGLWILWLCPIYQDRLRWHFYRAHLNIALIYGALALCFAWIGTLGGLLSLFFWLSASLLTVGLIYLCFDQNTFYKGKKGRPGWLTMLLFLPYYIGVRINIFLWLFKETQTHHMVYPKLVLGSIIATPHFNRVLDICAEYPLFNTPKDYHPFLLLDMVSPKASDLLKGADILNTLYHQSEDPILVCCALGYSRSALIVITWLVHFGHVNNIESALHLIHQSGHRTAISAKNLLLLEKVLYDTH